MARLKRLSIIDERLKEMLAVLKEEKERGKTKKKLDVIKYWVLKN